MFCKYCGKELEREDLKFCPFCGGSLKQEEQAEAIEEAEEVVEEFSEEPEETYEYSENTEEEVIVEDDSEIKQNAKSAFILGIVSLNLFWLGLVSVILSIVGLSKSKKAKGAQTQPSKIFRKLGKIFSIISLILGIFYSIYWFFLICSVIISLFA